MFEYDTGHLATSHWTAAAQLRHGIARKDYRDRKAAIVLAEARMRRGAARARLMEAAKQVLLHPQRFLFAGDPNPSETTGTGD